jgi:hypothetical protein
MSKDDIVEKSEKGFDGDKLLFDNNKSKKKKKLVKESNNNDDDEEDDENLDEDDDIQTESVKYSSRKKDIHKDNDVITIKIPRISRFMIERILYLAIIIVLLVMLFSGPRSPININFGGGGDIETDVLLSDEEVDVEDEVEVIVDDDEEVELSKDFWGVVDSECIPVDSEFDGKQFSGEAECELDILKTCSGDIEVEIIAINMDKNDNKMVNNIVVEIVNNGNKDINNFYGDLKWYNSDSDVDVKLLSRLKNSELSNIAGKYPFTNQNIKRCGGEKAIVITNKELATTFLSTREIPNTFEFTFYDYDDNSKKIDSSNKILGSDN